MKAVFRIIVALAIVAGGICIWQWLFPSQEKIIAGQFEKIAHAASVRPGEGTIPRLLGAQTVGDYCSSNVDISVDIPRYQHHSSATRDQIVQGIAAVNSSGGMTVKFQDILVTISADGETAQAEMTVEVQSPGQSDITVQQMRFTLRKTEGKWLITRVQTIRPLS